MNEEEEAFAMLEDLISKTIVIQAERDVFEQSATALRDELATARQHIAALEERLLGADDAVVQDIDRMDSALRGSMADIGDAVKSMGEFNKVAHLSYSLEAVRSAKKTQDSELAMLRTENESLKNENNMLKGHFEHSTKRR